MAILRLTALAADGELAVHAKRSDDDMVLAIDANDLHIEIHVGDTAEDADNLAGQLSNALAEVTSWQQ